MKTHLRYGTVASEQIYSSFIYSSGGGSESRTTMIRTDRTSLNQRKQNFENDEVEKKLVSTLKSECVEEGLKLSEENGVILEIRWAVSYRD